MTDKLFWKDPYRKEFDAALVDQFPVTDGHAVILDRTCFYATSGGQPNDLGVLGSMPVTDVRLDGDRLLHIVKEPIRASEVRGVIDWTRRFDHMQQHSGQHMLSAAFFRLFQAETSSFHLGESECSIELDQPDLQDRHMQEAEDVTNDIICSALPVDAFFIDPERAEDYALRKSSDLKEALRIIRIADFDLSPCSGTHVRNTGEVGAVFVTGLERISQGVKISFLCGHRIRHRYRNHLSVLKSLSAELTTSVDLLPESVLKLRSQVKELRKDLTRLREEKLLGEIEELCGRSEQKEHGRRLIAVWNRPYEEVRFLAQRLTERASMFGALASVTDCRASFFKSREMDYDLKTVFQEFLKKASARGGGPPHLMEAGGFSPQSDLEALLKSLNWSF